MYEPEPIDPDGGSLTIRPVYEYEAAEYIDHLIRGDACVHRQGQARAEPPKVQPPIQFVAPSDEQPISLREELEAMGWFTDM